MSDQYAIEGNDTSGYVGVDPCYQGYANETDKPIITEAEAEVVAKQEPDTDFVKADAKSGKDEDKSEKTSEDNGAPSENGGSAPKTPATPPPASPAAPTV